eukprot:gnl/TRDRNA2_/TRDRNA2_200327_c0_seq1.p1 gnl/TRDRNA2_/TRDRNA2_200327_c0~~gnl/TRDRNA2_/TRDRNA2_200327_c0_seq1.p1  ORF type:complete len:327 (-),score=35.16 gnl/TRDRNA2_/TRDRNA2_200327_c0_seq1:472-1452(-)
MVGTQSDKRLQSSPSLPSQSLGAHSRHYPSLLCGAADLTTFALLRNELTFVPGDTHDKRFQLQVYRPDRRGCSTAEEAIRGSGSSALVAVVEQLCRVFHLELHRAWVNLYRANTTDNASFHRDNFRGRSGGDHINLAVGASFGAPRVLCWRWNDSSSKSHRRSTVQSENKHRDDGIHVEFEGGSGISADEHVLQQQITGKMDTSQSMKVWRVVQRNGDVFAFDRVANSVAEHCLEPEPSEGDRISVILWGRGELTTEERLSPLLEFRENVLTDADPELRTENDDLEGSGRRSPETSRTRRWSKAATANMELPVSQQRRRWQPKHKN